MEDDLGAGEVGEESAMVGDDFDGVIRWMKCNLSVGVVLCSHSDKDRTRGLLKPFKRPTTCHSKRGREGEWLDLSRRLDGSR